MVSCMVSLKTRFTTSIFDFGRPTLNGISQQRLFIRTSVSRWNRKPSFLYHRNYRQARQPTHSNQADRNEEEAKFFFIVDLERERMDDMRQQILRWTCFSYSTINFRIMLQYFKSKFTAGTLTNIHLTPKVIYRMTDIYITHRKRECFL